MPYKFTKEDSRRGGIASGEARRNKRTLRETAELLLHKELPKEVKEELAAKGFPAETFMDAIVCAVIESATNGNAQNFANLVKLLGEDVQRVELAPYDQSVEKMEAYFEEMRAEYNAQKN